MENKNNTPEILPEVVEFIDEQYESLKDVFGPKKTITSIVVSIACMIVGFASCIMFLPDDPNQAVQINNENNKEEK